MDKKIRQQFDLLKSCSRGREAKIVSNFLIQTAMAFFMLVSLIGAGFFYFIFSPMGLIINSYRYGSDIGKSMTQIRWEPRCTMHCPPLILLMNITRGLKELNTAYLTV